MLDYMVYLLRFLHILCVLGLLGLTSVCIIGIPWRKPDIRWLWGILVLGCCAMVTGTFLVFFSKFNFASPWIDAAYILTAAVLMGFSGLFWLHKHNPTSGSIRWPFASVVLLLLFIGVIYDAITKTTFLFG